MIDRLRYLAKEYDLEKDPLKRTLIAGAIVSEITEGPVSPETSEVSMGPISLDVDMARGHGWTEGQIERAWFVLQAVAKAEGEVAGLRHPELYKTEDGVTVFVGD